jgi:hypothetical protein
MNHHKRLLGILYIVSGVLQILFLTLVSFGMSLILNYAFAEGGGGSFKDEGLIDILDFIRLFAFLIVIVLSVPSIIAGIGLLNKQRWALVLALVVGCFKLFSFPVGTALGIYTLWVYFQDQSEQNSITPS